jgi:hypothetical protein
MASPLKFSSSGNCAGYDENHPGAVAEWLGRGLQSPVQRFKSAPRLLPLAFGGRTKN